jgi:hypothetical protein
MRRNIVKFALLLIAGGNPTLPIRFNPRVGSTYRYDLTSETSLTVKGGKKDVDADSKSAMTVNYGVSKDQGEFVLEMTFQKIHLYQKEGNVVMDADATQAAGASDPTRQLLAAFKAATIFARVHLSDYTVAFSGGVEVVDPMVKRNYAEADQAQARTYWRQWAEQEIIWKNLDPLTWIYPDTARRIGDHWRITFTNKEDINFKIDNHFLLETINGGIATIRSTGRISNDPAGTWLLGEPVTGNLTGKEEGVCFIDIATGMPVGVEYSVQVEGVVENGGRQERIKFGTTMKMKGKRVN